MVFLILEPGIHDVIVVDKIELAIVKWPRLQGLRLHKRSFNLVCYKIYYNSYIYIMQLLDSK